MKSDVQKMCMEHGSTVRYDYIQFLMSDPYTLT